MEVYWIVLGLGLSLLLRGDHMWYSVVMLSWDILRRYCVGLYDKFSILFVCTNFDSFLLSSMTSMTSMHCEMFSFVLLGEGMDTSASNSLSLRVVL